MKTIRNKTATPLRVPLPGGKTLHLAPAKEGQVADKAVDHPGMRKLLDDGKIEIVDDRGGGQRGGGSGSAVPTSKQGHQPSAVVVPKGDR